MLLQRKRLLMLLAVGALWLAYTTTVRADGVTVYTARSAYNSASTNNQTIDFTGTAPDDGFTDYPDGLTILGVSFTSQTARNSPYIEIRDLRAVGQFYSSPPNVNSNWQSGVTLTGGRYEERPGESFDYRGFLDVTLPAGGVTAFGVDLGSEWPGFITITLSTGEVFQISSNSAPNFTFFGFTSTVPVDWIRFRTSSIRGEASHVVMDNVTFGQANAVPEPATLLLLGTGLGGLAAKVRRRRKE